MMQIICDALHEAAHSTQEVTLEYLVSGSDIWTFTCNILGVDAVRGKFQFLRREGEVPREYAIKYLFRITLPCGKVVPNEDALRTHEAAIARREHRAREILSLRADVTVLAPNTGSYKCLDTVDGSLNGQPRQFYVFGAENRTKTMAVIHAKDALAAQRAMSLVESPHSFWECFDILLKAHFIWVAWLSLRREGREIAQALRGDTPVLDDGASIAERLQREALYHEAGLNHAAYGAGADLMWFEGREPDYLALFELADKVPAELLRQYLIYSYETSEYFNYKKEHDDRDISSFIHYGLCRKCHPPSIEEVVEKLPIRMLRDLVAASGSNFKARSGAVLGQHLLGRITPQQEAEARKHSRIPQYQMLPPPGLSWKDFQFIRQDYKWMVHELAQWMFNGMSPPKAGQIFKAMV